jgi:hypothetical protein
MNVDQRNSGSGRGTEKNLGVTKRKIPLKCYMRASRLLFKLIFWKIKKYNIFLKFELVKAFYT